MARLISAILLLAAFASAQNPAEVDVVAVVQMTFDGMTVHDADTIRSTLLPDAKIYSIRDEGPPTAISAEDFVTRIAAMKLPVLERFTSKPAVSIRGRMAQVWGPYDFHRDGIFTHCGVDSISLLKTAQGWKIATIVYTVETTGCESH